MIVSKTPLRVSFFSGGTDMKSFYMREPGAALSATIDKYIYVSANYTQHAGIRTMYDETVDATNLNELKHVIIREALKTLNVTNEITISSIADVKAHGAGLGSSSAFTVGLLNALIRTLDREFSDPFELAELACKIEIELCGYPIGKQDQYAAAFGGVNLFEFNADETVTVKSSAEMDQSLAALQRNLLLVYSGQSRIAGDILVRQQSEMALEDTKFRAAAKSRDRAYQAKEYLEAGDINSFGSLLHEAWADKKQTVSGMSGDFFDDVYDRAIKAGSLGGKLLGAGGGGFFLFYVDPEKREAVKQAVTKCLPCLIYDFEFTFEGSSTVSI